MPSTPQTSSVPDLDAVASTRWQHLPRAKSPWLHEEIGRRMAERLDWIKREPQRWVSWSPLLGGLAAHEAVTRRYPQAVCQIEGPQQAAARSLLEGVGTKPLWRRWMAAIKGASGTPVSVAGQADLLWANLSLHIHEHPQQLLKAWLRLLQTEGMLMFSCLGPDTLREIRHVHALQGWTPPAHPMTDMHDWGDMLIEAGFAEPVMDVERLTLTYSHAQAMLNDMRDWGRNLHGGRSGHLRGRAFRAAWLDAVEASAPRTPDGQLQLTIEVIYGHAIKPVPRVKVTEATSVSMDDMRQLLKKGRPSSRHPSV